MPARSEDRPDWTSVNWQTMAPIPLMRRSQAARCVGKASSGCCSSSVDNRPYQANRRGLASSSAILPPGPVQ